MAAGWGWARPTWTKTNNKMLTCGRQGAHESRCDSQQCCQIHLAHHDVLKGVWKGMEKSERTDNTDIGILLTNVEHSLNFSLSSRFISILRRRTDVVGFVCTAVYTSVAVTNFANEMEMSRNRSHPPPRCALSHPSFRASRSEEKCSKTLGNRESSRDKKAVGISEKPKGQKLEQ